MTRKTPSRTSALSGRESDNAEYKDVYVSVGSNIEPEENIPKALMALMENVPVSGSSTFYRTAPLGNPNQPLFYNGVWQLKTRLEPRHLKFNILRHIESQLGRVRTSDPNQPREIDLDLILYGDAVIRDADLHIPDPGIRSRPFIARPLIELVPNLILPDTGEKLALLPVAKGGPLEALKAFTNKLKGLVQT